MTASNSSSLVLAIIGPAMMPALLTSTSRRPNSSTAVRINRAACSQSATLAPLAATSPPAERISSTTAWALLPPPAGNRQADSISLTTTRAPSARGQRMRQPIRPRRRSR